jgi:oxygen-dependent protoporphyrinogen oxidase
VTDFTVVGGGIAGLVMAYRLAEAGRSVALLEASERLGGTVATHRVGGIDLDAGAESFARRGGTVAALAAELGLGGDVATPATDGAWLQPVTGRPVPLPAAGILGIPGTPLARDVIAVVGRAGAVRARLDAVIPSRWGVNPPSVGALVRRRMGSAVLDRLVAPVVHGVYSVHPDELALDRVPGLRAAVERHGSLAAAVRALGAAAPSGSAVEGIRGGVHRLVVELRARCEGLGVDIQLGRRVTSLEDLDGTVVVAAPGVLAPVGGRRVVLATLVVENPALDAAPRGSGLLVAPGARGVRARALTHSTAKWAWLRERAAGRHVLRLSYDNEPQQFAEVARSDAAALLGVELPVESIVDFARVEWTRPAPFIPPSGTPVPTGPVLAGPILVGETVGGSGIAGIVAHATATAHDLLARPRA